MLEEGECGRRIQSVIQSEGFHFLVDITHLHDLISQISNPVLLIFILNLSSLGTD
jgi:hypothetical protein